MRNLSTTARSAIRHLYNATQQTGQIILRTRLPVSNVFFNALQSGHLLTEHRYKQEISRSSDVKVIVIIFSQ